MSKKENTTEEKIVTKYDRKVQKRKEEKEKEAKEKAVTLIGSIAIVGALLCLVASFPIRTYMSLHNTFVTIGQDDVTKVEFDYNYNVVKDNYIQSYGQYLSYFGLDTSKDLSAQMYDEDMTWQDYFQEMTVDNLKRSKSLKADALAAGYQYDATEEYAKFEKDLRKAASDAGENLNDFVRKQYGDLATLKRIEPYVKEALMITSYYEKVTKDKLPSDEEIVAHYEEDPAEYDVVDYRVSEIYAELPTEPTDLADSADKSEDGEASDTYEPSDAEVEKAMADAKAKADTALATIKTAGELKEKVRHDSAVYLIREWLFDEERRAGDTTILEDTVSNKYYVLAFEKRYRDETPTASARILMTTDNGQAILDEWKKGAATQESFAELCDKRTVDTSVKGGLYEDLSRDGLNDTLKDWLFAEERKEGDVVSLDVDETYDYVVYFVSFGRPSWKSEIEQEISSETMSEYVEALTEACQVLDPKDHLPYIKIREKQKAEEEAQEAEHDHDHEDEDGAIDLGDIGIETGDDDLEAEIELIE